MCVKQFHAVLIFCRQPLLLHGVLPPLLLVLVLVLVLPLRSEAVRRAAVNRGEHLIDFDVIEVLFSPARTLSQMTSLTGFIGPCQSSSRHLVSIR